MKKGEDAGKHLTVGEFVGIVPGIFYFDDWWTVTESFEDGLTHASASMIMRIDGHEPETQDVKQAMEVE